jgi:hypothetical protein
VKRRRLSHPCETLTEVNRSAQYKDHGTPIRELIGAVGMRTLGRALDLSSKGKRKRIDRG